MFGLRRRPGQPGWGDLLGSIGRSTLDLLGAEVEGARAELVELARRALGVVAVALVAFALAFWALGAAIAAAIAGLAVWLPVWGAALVVFGALAIVALGFALVTRARFRQLEDPGEIVRRRFADHLEFWRTEILAGDGEPEDETASRHDPRGERGSGRPRISVAPPPVDDYPEL